MTVPPSFLQQRLPLGDLLDLRAFGDVCHSFAELYRIGIKVFDEAGNKLVDVQVGNTDFCGYIWSKPPAARAASPRSGKVKCDPLARSRSRTRAVLLRLPVRRAAHPLRGRRRSGGWCSARSCPEDLAELPAALRGDLARLRREARAGATWRRSGACRSPTAEKILKHFMDLLDVMVFTGHKNLIAAKLHIEAVQESYRELQEKNRELEDSYAKLKELDRLKSNFLATMSHELRTPLTSVIGYSEMMLEGLGGPLTAEQREYLGIIMEKGENLLQLITSILDISKIEAGRVRLVLSDVDATQIMRDAVATVLPLARKKGLKVACERGRDAARPGRPRQAPPVPREPLLERGEVHARRAGPSRVSAEALAGRPARHPRRGQRHRHRRGAPREGVRRLLPGGRLLHPRVRRRRPRPRHREELRRGARRRGGRPLHARARARRSRSSLPLAPARRAGATPRSAPIAGGRARV